MPSKSSASDGTEQYSSVARRSIILNPDELELWEMFYYAGLTIDPQVFHVIADLIGMDIHPRAIVDVLEAVAPNSKHYVPQNSNEADKTVGNKKPRASKGTIPSLQAPIRTSNRKTSKSSSDAGKSDSSRPSRSATLEKGSTRDSKHS